MILAVIVVIVSFTMNRYFTKKEVESFIIAAILPKAEESKSA